MSRCMAEYAVGEVMSAGRFKKLFETLKHPVAVCSRDDDRSVIYLNPAARLFFSPYMSIDQLQGISALGSLESFLRFKNRGDYLAFCDGLDNAGYIEDLSATLFTHQNCPVDVILNANKASIGNSRFFIIYVRITDKAVRAEEETAGEVLANILNEAYRAKDAPETIKTVLALAGRHFDVSRVYVIENGPGNTFSNTYEWCNDGVEPMLDLLQNLSNDQYHIRRGYVVVHVCS